MKLYTTATKELFTKQSIIYIVAVPSCKL